MKRQIFFRVAALLLLASMSFTVFAALPRVIDNAELLTSEEVARLESDADAIESEFNLDVVILTTPSMNHQTARDFADGYYDAMGYADDGVLFLLAMEEREWYISTCGTAITLISDEEIQYLDDIVLYWLSEGDYYHAFDGWLSALPDVLKQGGTATPGASHGPSPDYNPDQYRTPASSQKSIVGIWGTSVLIGAVVATIVVLIMRGSMNTKRKQQAATDYLDAGSFQLYSNQDIFLYSNVSKSLRQTNSSSGSSGGGSRSSGGGGGRSHGGGGGKF